MKPHRPKSHHPLAGQGRKFTNDSHRREDVERLAHNAAQAIEDRVNKAMAKRK